MSKALSKRSAPSAKPAFLPAEAVDFLHRRAIQAGGLLLVLLAGGFAAALVTFSLHDASLNTATDAPAHNVLGIIGASIADLSLQFLGLAAALLALAPLMWGLRLFVLEAPTRFWLRAVLLLAALATAAIALAGWKTPAQWPLPSGMGGAAGALLLDALTQAAFSVLKLAGLAFSADLPRIMIAGVAGVAALSLFSYALGLSLSDWRKAFSASAATASMTADISRKAYGIALATADHFSKLARSATERQEPQFFSAPESEPIPADPAPEPALAREAELVAPKAPRLAPGKKEKASRQRTLDLPKPTADGFILPSIELLTPPVEASKASRVNEDALTQNAKLLENVLKDFGVNGQIVKVRPGPVVTLYELEPAPGTKISRVISLADDIARSMSAVSVRIAVVPGRSVIGIELPNAKRETVYLRELLTSEAFESAAAKLTLALGKDIGGAPVLVDLARMPHLLVAGTTGSGKSVGVNAMILSLLYRLSPEEVRFIMIDPKMLELSVYDGIPHLLAPVVTEPGKAVVALKWTVKEMENRYRSMSQLSVRNIAGYNQRLKEARTKGENLTRTVQTGFDPETGRPIYEEQPLDLNPLPNIVVVVDEMADLMLVAGKDIEAAVQRLAQMARAAGIHLIMATQRPSVDVITGTIKANFPTRISFQVTSRIDSRTILGEQGAEQLLGQGDMLHMAPGGRILRVHGPFVSDQEVEAVVEHLRNQGEPEYQEDVTTEEEEIPAGGQSFDTGDALYQQAVDLVLRERKASTSFVQRHLQIGYNRAARIIDQMEADGVIGPANHVGKREVLGRS